MYSITPVILCGGSGTRLWPLSREYYPKQFVTFGEKPTLFAQTLTACGGIAWQRTTGDHLQRDTPLLRTGSLAFLPTEGAHPAGACTT